MVSGDMHQTVTDALVCFFCLWVMPETKLTNLAADILEKCLQKRTKFSRLLRGGGVDVYHDPLGNQNIEGCKKICIAFLHTGLSDLDEIWHDGGLKGYQVLCNFGELWPTFSGAHIFDCGYLRHLTHCDEIWVG